MMNDLKDLARIFPRDLAKQESSPPPEHTPAAEIIRLLREIHAAVCGEKNETSPPPAPRRPSIVQEILNVMRDGDYYASFTIFEILQAQGVDCVESTVATCCASLAKKGIINRIRRNLYRMPIAPVTNNNEV